MISIEDLRSIAKTTTYPKTKPRKKYLTKIEPWIANKEIIILKGIRRSGKTSIMYQLIEKLRKDTDNVIYINFDDYRLSKHLNVELLEALLTIRNTTKIAYYFLDEIQHVPGYEKWLRTHYDQGLNVKFIIGGSNISLLNPQAATVLTGRNITFEVYPLTYDEFTEFSGEPLSEYLLYGGFPEVALQDNQQKKKTLLAQYINDIIAKDILTRYPVENPRKLTALVYFFLSNPGVRLTVAKLAKQLGTHNETAEKYVSYIIDTFLIFEVPFFSYSTKTKYISAFAPKYYAIDNGFITACSFKENQGTLLENAVAMHLHTTGKNPTYWLDKKEIDFVYEKTAMQVTAFDEIPQREIEAFIDFEKKNKKYRQVIVTNKKSGKKENIELVPIKKFLQNNS